MDLVAWEAVKVDCTGKLRRTGQFNGQTRHWRQLDWGCSIPQLMTVDAGGEQSTGNIGACVLSPRRQRAGQDRMWLCLCHALAQHLGSGTTQLSSGTLDGCLVPSFSRCFKPRNNSSKCGLMNHCKCLMCWQLLASQLHTLFCCRNFKKLLEQCPPPPKKVYPEIWEVMYAALPQFICTQPFG